jgi:outer membrane protein insertion porin family
MCPPLGVYINKCGESEYVPCGAKTMFNLNLETRFPIYTDIRGVVFQDFGALIGNSLQNFMNSQFVYGTGFGFRYDTVIGPLRFDIGWKLKKSKFYRYSFAWFLTFGHAF